MKLKKILATSLKSLLILSTCLAVLCSSYIQSVACAGGEDYDDTYYIMPVAEGYNASHFSWHHTLFGEGKQDIQKDNLDEWVNILHLDESAKEDIKKLYFDTDEAKFTQILTGLESGILDQAWQENKMLLALNKKKKDQDLIDYLLFSKKLEKELNRANGYENWGEELPHDTLLLKQWFDESGIKADKVKNKELRFRYAYQQQRLAFHLNRFEKVIELYENDLKKWKSALMTKALSNKFGALWRLKAANEEQEFKRNAEMILDLYQVFNACADCPIIHYQDLAVLTANEFFEAEKQLKEPEDKCKLWYMAAFETVPIDYSFGKIAAIDPNSPLLELLMSRQIILWQREALRRNQTQENSSVPNQPEMAYALNKLGKNTKVNNQSIWLCQLAFYHFLRKDNQMALQVLFEAESVKGNKEENSLKANKVLTDLIVIENWTKGDLKSSMLAHKLEKINASGNEQLLEFALRKIETLASPHDYLYEYEVLANANINGFIGSYNLSELERLEKSMQTRSTPLLKYLWKHSNINLNRIQIAKGSWYLNKRLFVKALTCFKNGKDDIVLQADPFVIHLVDCHDCDIKAAQTKASALTRIAFIEKIIGLKKTLNTGTDAANTAILLGNALYNMTEYGNNRPLTIDQFNKSDLMHPDYRDPEKGPKFKNDEPDYYTNMEWAKYYYSLANKLSKDPEIKAKTHFLLAKCEQNDYYNEHRTTYMEAGCDDLKNISYRVNFKKLSVNYAKTKFYQEALKECSYFEHYTKAHLIK